MRFSLLLVPLLLYGSPAWGQPEIRRVQPKAFPFAVTPSFGMGFGATRATWVDPAVCGSPNCYEYGSGSGWQAGLDVQVPIGSTFGIEVGGQLGHPSRKDCLRGACLSPDKSWSYRGTALVLWRFKARAPIYFGVGGTIVRYDPGPVPVQEVATTEYGATTAVGFDFPMSDRLGGRVLWRSYVLGPSSDGLPADYGTKSVAWENAFLFGVRILLGS